MSGTRREARRRPCSRSAVIDPLSPSDHHRQPPDPRDGVERRVDLVEREGGIGRARADGPEAPIGSREALRGPVERDRGHDPPRRRRDPCDGASVGIRDPDRSGAVGDRCRRASRQAPSRRGARVAASTTAIASPRIGAAAPPWALPRRTAAIAPPRHEDDRPHRHSPVRSAAARGGESAGAPPVAASSRVTGGANAGSWRRIACSSAAQLRAGLDPELLARGSAGRRGSARARRPVDRCGRGPASAALAPAHRAARPRRRARGRG